ncbi:MAG TPA: DivIVA domain-containing protein [Microthrixaceae bacterium]|nr:DivIVA domain-containing protein [Microthrixaceae bacterium]
MDVTPQLIEQIDFSERRFGGYDPDQVDDFLERVGATLSRLEAEVASEKRRADQAESTLAELREHPPTTAEPAPMADDTDVAQATSTLLLAKRTAEAAINEARSEATKLLTDTRARVEIETRDAAAESERLVREAQVQRDDMLRTAREEADAEFAGQRERLKDEIAQLDATKLRLGDDVRLVEGRLDEYRGALTATHETIGRLLDDPDTLRARPPLDVDLTPIVDSAPPELIPDDEVSLVSDAPEGTQTAGDPWGPGSWAQVSAAFEEGASEDTAKPDDTAEPAASERPTASGRDEQDAGLGEDTPSAGESSLVSDDPVVDDPDGPAADDVFEPRVDDVESVGRAASVDEPTAAYTLTTATGEHDRYLQELHDAVNTEAVDPDPAMEEFFEREGDRPKRFGRRR